MNPMLTEEEFYEAWCSCMGAGRISESESEIRRYEAEHHPLVDRYAIITVPNSTIYKRKLRVKRATDNQVVFELSVAGELIVNKDRYGGWNERDVSELIWVEE